MERIDTDSLAKKDYEEELKELRMSSLKRMFWVAVAVFILVTLGFKVVRPMQYEKNVTILENGQPIILTANEPVMMSVYSEKSQLGATVYDKDGAVVLVTRRSEIRPNYFEGVAKVAAGKYVLAGDTSSLVFAGSGFVGLYNPTDDQYSWNMAFLFSVLLTLSLWGSVWQGYAAEVKILKRWHGR